MTYTSQGASYDSNEVASVGGKYKSMNENGPNGSPYETLAKYDQSETKCDTKTLVLGLRTLSPDQFTSPEAFFRGL
jgi:hypothetical protein